MAIQDKCLTTLVSDMSRSGMRLITIPPASVTPAPISPTQRQPGHLVSWSPHPLSPCHARLGLPRSSAV